MDNITKIWVDEKYTVDLWRISGMSVAHCSICWLTVNQLTDQHYWPICQSISRPTLGQLLLDVLAHMSTYRTLYSRPTDVGREVDWELANNYVDWCGDQELANMSTDTRPRGAQTRCEGIINKSNLNLLSPKSDQRQISPCNITAL